MREMLNKFPKEVLVEYLVKRGFFRGKDLEYELTSIHWERESGEALKQMEVIAEEKKRHKVMSPKWLEAELKYQAAERRLERSDRLYKRLEALREARRQQ